MSLTCSMLWMRCWIQSSRFLRDTTRYMSTFLLHWKLEVWQRVLLDPDPRYTYSEVWRISVLHREIIIFS